MIHRFAPVVASVIAFGLTVLAPQSNFAQVPAGKGVFIKSLREWKTDDITSDGSAIKKPGADRHMTSMKANLNPRINNASWPAVFQGVPIQTTGTHAVKIIVTVNSNETTAPDRACYSNLDIMNRLKALGTNWVAVKCLEGDKMLSQWDANLVDSATSAGIQLYAYQMLTFDKFGKSQANSLINVLTSTSLCPRGVFVMPVFNDDDNSTRSKPGNQTSLSSVANDYLLTLQYNYEQHPTPRPTIIYSPPVTGYDKCSNDEKQLHKLFTKKDNYNDLIQAYAPRFYWRAAKRNTTATIQATTRRQQVTASLITKWLDDKSIEGKPIIPLGQSQFYKDGNRNDFSVIPKFLNTLSGAISEGEPVPAVGFWLFESMTPTDEASYYHATWPPTNLAPSSQPPATDSEIRTLLDNYYAVMATDKAPGSPIARNIDRDPSDCLPTDNSQPPIGGDDE